MKKISFGVRRKEAQRKNIWTYLQGSGARGKWEGTIKEVEPPEFCALETEVSFKRKIWLTKSNAAQQSSQMMSVERVGFDSEQVIIKLERTGSVE